MQGTNTYIHETAQAKPKASLMTRLLPISTRPADADIIPDAPGSRILSCPQSVLWSACHPHAGSIALRHIRLWVVASTVYVQ